MFLYRYNFRILENKQNCRSWVILKTGQCKQGDLALDVRTEKVAGGPLDAMGISGYRNQMEFIHSIVCIEPIPDNSIDLVLPSGL